MNFLIFDIETIPDVSSGRRLYGNPAEMAELSDEDVAKVMTYQRYQDSDGQTEILRHHLQKVVAISVIFRFQGYFKGELKDVLEVRSLGDLNSDEHELVRQFFGIIQKYTPTLISWNGTQFDLPVLNYRSLLHGIPAPRYWTRQQQTIDQQIYHFQWNNYTSRYHERHTDLMDVLSGYSGAASAKLDEIAVMLGFAGKMGMSGDKVWDTYLKQGQQGLQQIRDYCETDVLNTYLIFLRFELIRGHITQETHDTEVERVRQLLQHEAKPHFLEFLNKWQENI